MNWRNWLTGTTVAGNELWRILLFFGVLLLSSVAGRALRQTLLFTAERFKQRQRRFVSVAVRSLASAAGALCLVIGLHVGVGVLRLGPGLQSAAGTSLGVAVVAAIAWALYCLVDVVDVWLRSLVSRTSSKLDDMLVPMVRKSLRVTIVLLAVLQAATLLSDKPVTSLLAGLGVGGLAVALASQDTLKNLFGSVVIFADKPFEMGDRIAVDDQDGTVEEVGFRSTRLRTLEGHLVTIANSDLANKMIRNISRRPNIRRVLNIGITYDTPPEKVERALAILKELLRDHEGLDPRFPPRVFFDEFKDYSLNLLAIYWYHPADYWAYLAFSERLNLQILQRFNAEGIAFAFPTQTLYLARENRPGG